MLVNNLSPRGVYESWGEMKNSRATLNNNVAETKTSLGPTNIVPLKLSLINSITWYYNFEWWTLKHRRN